MKKSKLKILFISIILMMFLVTISNASYSDVTMSVVEEPVCNIDFGTSSHVERRVISKDLENKEITIQLKVTNEEDILKPTGEIMLVIDNSKSMLDPVTTTQTREDLVISSAETLIQNLLDNNNQLKIGIVSFSTSTTPSKEGTIEDAKLISELSNNADNLINSVSNIEYNGPRTDLDSGITLAKKYFSETDNNKYLIVLSDGVPNVALDYDKNYYSDDVISKTKTSLLSLGNISNCKVITMLTGITNGDATAFPSNKTYNQIISEIFGTTTNPTIGKFYYITDDQIESTITSSIYKDLLPVSQTIKNIKVVDTFSKEIVENFDFSYVQNPNFGTISKEIDKTTNSITWNITELKSGETAIVQYKLKLKEEYDANILDKVLDTNDDLSITYTDFSNNTDTKNSDITPKIKLTEPEPEPLPVEYPKTGSTILYGIIGLVSIVTIISGIKYYNVRF